MKPSCLPMANEPQMRTTRSKPAPQRPCGITVGLTKRWNAWPSLTTPHHIEVQLG